LLNDNNISSSLLSTEQINKLLSEHKSNLKDNSIILGKLITIENWYKMVNKVKQELDRTEFDTKSNKIT